MSELVKHWLVWNLNNSLSTARCKHYSKEDAQREAERLAGANPGTTFLVLKTVGGAIATANVEKVTLIPYGDGIPF